MARASRKRRPDRPREKLALTPMVFVMWKPRYDAFIKKYGTINFRNLAKAMQEPGGWGAIADHPEWGLFKFGHTHPNKSNSGLLTLTLMAYEFSGKQRGLTLSDITEPKFQTWLSTFARGHAAWRTPDREFRHDDARDGPAGTVTI